MRPHYEKIFFLIFMIAILSIISVFLVSQASGEEARYHPYQEIMDDIQEIADEHPDIVTIHNLSEEYDAPLTYQNRSLIAVRVTDDDGNGEPQTLITGAHHAREWISIEVSMYYLHYLVDNYGTDPYVSYLVDNRDIWIIPIVNPDGYVQSWKQNDRAQNWTGWRKNCRDNDGDGVLESGEGVDLNRNYDCMWGYDDSGSSGSSSSTTYRGPAPFSEPETQAIRNLSLANNFRTVVHYHSKGNMNLYPWAYDSLDTDDHETYVSMGAAMTSFNGYEHGNTNSGTIYKCNGEACDWFYAEFGSFAFTIELGYAKDRYIPDESRIIPISQENLGANLFMCLAADPEYYENGFFWEGHDVSAPQWEQSGNGDPWEPINETVNGEDSWYAQATGDPGNETILALNISLTEQSYPLYLGLWQKYDLSGGSSATLCLRDSQQDLTPIPEYTGLSGGRSSPDTRSSADFRSSPDTGLDDESDDGPTGSSRGSETDSGRGTGSISDWTRVIYDLTPYLDDEPRSPVFILETEDGLSGDFWYIAGVEVSSVPPYEVLSNEQQGDEYAFSIDPGQYVLTLEPGAEYTLPVNLTNEVADSNTIDLSVFSDQSDWTLIFSVGGEELDNVTLGDHETLRVNITITLPDMITAGEIWDFTLTFRSRQNTSQEYILDMNVTIDEVFHITIQDQDDNHVLPGESRNIPLMVTNQGNSRVEIITDYNILSGGKDGWSVELGGSFMIDEYSNGQFSLSVTAPAMIEADELLEVEIIVKVSGQSFGDGTDDVIVKFIIDEKIEGGFQLLDDPVARPGEENEIRIRARNFGNMETTFTFSTSSAWNATISVPSRQIDAYSQSTIILTLDPPDDTYPDEEQIITLTIKVGTSYVNNTAFTFTSTSYYRVKIDVKTINVTIPAGLQKSVTLTVYNSGNTANDISLDASNPGGFSLEFSKSQLNIPAFSQSMLTLKITAPGTKDAGTILYISVVATSDEDPTQSDTSDIQVTIGKSYAVSLSIDSEERRQEQAPGGTTEFIITLENNGNSEATVEITLQGVPEKWDTVMDSTTITLDSDGSRKFRLTVTSPSGAGNKDEAKITIKATAGDDEFGEVSDEVTATVVVSADESSGGISIMMFAVGGILIFLILGFVMLMYLSRSRDESIADVLGGFFQGTSGSDDVTDGTVDNLNMPAENEITSPMKQYVSCPKCSAGFEVELPPGDKKQVKTMCLECGEIFTFQRAEPAPAPSLIPVTPTHQEVSCPKCSAGFEVELPPGNKKEVKTMCLECGEIFTFQRADPLPTPPSTTPVIPTHQNVSCPKCSAGFEVELPPGDKKEVKTMCLECGEIFTFERKIPEPVPSSGDNAGDIRETEGSSGIPPGPLPETPTETPPEMPSQEVDCPLCNAHFGVQLPPGQKAEIKTMCPGCGGIFAFTRSTPKKEMRDIVQEPQQSQETTPREAEVSSIHLHDRETTVPDKPPEIGPVPEMRPEKPAGIDASGKPETVTDEGITSRDPKAGMDLPQDEGLSSRDTRTEAAISQPEGEGKAVEDHQSLASKPRTKQCPKCGRKIFLKGKEEMVKCMFCGTRIQFERKKKKA